MSPIWILKHLVSVFLNACHLLLALPPLSEFGRGRLSLVVISFYALSYFLGRVACRNLPWQGLQNGHKTAKPPVRERWTLKLSRVVLFIVEKYLSSCVSNILAKYCWYFVDNEAMTMKDNITREWWNDQSQKSAGNKFHVVGWNVFYLSSLKVPCELHFLPLADSYFLIEIRLWEIHVYLQATLRDLMILFIFCVLVHLFWLNLKVWPRASLWFAYLEQQRTREEIQSPRSLHQQQFWL